MAAAAPHRAFQFGAFELDHHTGELRKRGIRIKLQEQPFQVLALLVERAGDVVGREEIRSKLWPENTFVDFDNAISSAVRKLREALGDSSENPRFIETIARRGYRFVAPVSKNDERLRLPVAETSPLSQPRTRKWSRRTWLSILGCSLAGAGLIALLVTERIRMVEPDLRPTPLTSYPGWEGRPSFSPDGSRIAFFWDGPDQQHPAVYIKMMDSGNPVRLTDGLHPAGSPAWSPDGRTIAFYRRLDVDHGAIMTIPALGGHEKEFARIENPLPTSDTDLVPTSPYLSWSADSKISIYIRPQQSGSENFCDRSAIRNRRAEADDISTAGHRGQRNRSIL
ncbi:MAG: winged helix-turn-helix domain-containing protein [Bryobacteraceae bacterium]